MVMSFFWLGTLPALIAAGTSISRDLITGRWGSMMPWVTASLMIVTGLTTITLRVVRPCQAETSPSVVSTLMSSFCNGSPKH